MACLQAAIDLNNVQGVRSVLSKGSAQSLIDVQDADGTWPLVKAATLGHADIVRVLLTEGANVNQASNGFATGQYRGMTALHAASGNGLLDTVRVLVDNAADVNKASLEPGLSALHCAAQHGHYEVAVLLLECSADAKNACAGQTALQLAVRFHHSRVASLLAKQARSTLKKETIVCALCHLTKDELSKSLKPCAKCLEVFYCSKEHQVADWPVHKRSCTRS